MPPQQHGHVQGWIGSLGGLSTLLGVPLLTHVFLVFTDGRLEWTFAGAPFVVSATAVLGSIWALRACKSARER
jgi:hypothetical protein